MRISSRIAALSSKKRRPSLTPRLHGAWIVSRIPCNVLSKCRPSCLKALAGIVWIIVQEMAKYPERLKQRDSNLVLELYKKEVRVSDNLPSTKTRMEY